MCFLLELALQLFKSETGETIRMWFIDMTKYSHVFFFKPTLYYFCVHLIMIKQHN